MSVFEAPFKGGFGIDDENNDKQSEMNSSPITRFKLPNESPEQGMYMREKSAGSTLSNKFQERHTEPVKEEEEDGGDEKISEKQNETEKEREMSNRKSQAHKYQSQYRNQQSPEDKHIDEYEDEHRENDRDVYTREQRYDNNHFYQEKEQLQQRQHGEESGQGQGQGHGLNKNIHIRENETIEHNDASHLDRNAVKHVRYAVDYTSSPERAEYSRYGSESRSREQRAGKEHNEYLTKDRDRDRDEYIVILTLIDYNTPLKVQDRAS